MRVPYTMPPQFLSSMQSGCDNHTMPHNMVIDLDYFNGGKVCKDCESPIDLWKVYLDEINLNFANINALSVIGMYWTVDRIYLQPDRISTIDCEKLGIPENARLININYTPGMGLFPIELHGNMPHRKTPRNISLYPRPTQEVPPSSVEVDVSIYWIENNEFNLGSKSIIDAFEEYYAGKINDAIIPASVTVEDSLEFLFFDFLAALTGKEKPRANYEQRLNILLPMIKLLDGIPPFPPFLPEKLQVLKELRNQMAHSWKIKKKVAKEEVADLLCATLFTLHYCHLVRPLLLKVLSQSSNP